jgi:hypothetical protein
MTFQYSDLKKNTNVDHKLFYALARNDDFLKEISSKSSGGVVARFELESSLEVPAIEPDLGLDNGNEPVLLARAEFVAEESRCYSFDLWGAGVVFPPTAGNVRQTFFSIMLGIDVENEDMTYVPEPNFTLSYPMQVGHRFRTKNDRLFQDGPIRGKLMAKVDDQQYKIPFNQRSIRNYDPITSRFIEHLNHYFAIPSGKIEVLLTIPRTHVRQQVIASSKSKLQFVVKDMGEWLYV